MMKNLVSSALLGSIVLVSAVAWGHTVSAVKVECMGNDCQSISLGDACGTFVATNWVPFAVACDDTSSEEYAGQYACGSNGATCENLARVSRTQRVGEYCDDGGGNDSVVMCTDDQNLAITPVKVECMGDCNNVNLQQICGPLGLSVVDVACDDAADPGQGNDRSCGTATCRDWGYLASSDPLGAYCKDGGGYDAVVSCGTVPATRAVKVECWGSSCNNVTIGDICGVTGNTMLLTPFQIACDDTATPGSGTVHNPCASSWGGSTCTTWGGVWGSDPLGAYCGDGAGFDAVINCP